ncbi:MAG TPA: GNAT family N-acetyltransferase [Ohtaekwangia sp.]|uniref:GNAT family N-acetyltransferase n=1 Tax=Ohtaekwangia sp. TaxID=2066019 RepID=UPI002F92695E
MIQIRKATHKDLATLVDFQQKLAYETENIQLDRETLYKGMQAIFDDAAKGFYTVAEEGGVVVGCYLITYEWSEWRNGMVWWLQSVYVLESYRKKGVFRMMYAHVIQSIKNDTSLIGLRLYVDKSNARAMQVYESMGMNGEHYTVYEWMK